MSHFILAAKSVKYLVLAYRQDAEHREVKGLASGPTSRQSQCRDQNPHCQASRVRRPFRGFSSAFLNLSLTSVNRRL